MPEPLPGRRPGSLRIEEIKDLVGTDAPVILELGANNGSHSSRFLSVFPKARLFCFEPDPRAIRKWRARMNNRGELVEAAVGAVDGPVTFYTSAGRESVHPEGFDLAGSIRRPTVLAEQRWSDIRFAETQITVQCLRLDTFAKQKQLEKIDFIWCDVQGAENDVIVGGADTLARTGYFYTEYLQAEYYEGQTNLNGLIAMLPDFELIQLYKVDALFRKRQL